METLGRVPVDTLLLDPDNPRLPEGVQGAAPDEVLAYLEQHDVLDELAASFVANGYFPNEPILVLPPDSDGQRVVVEGNRRLAALMVLLQLPAAVDAGLAFDLVSEPTRARLEELRTVPAVEVEDRDEVLAFLGYRHINGLRQWMPEAKARYLWREVEREALEHPDRDAFYEIGRRMGSNSRGVRTNYLSYELLRQAREEHDLDPRSVLRRRFGVWVRLLSAGGILEHIGYSGSPRSREEVRAAAARTDGVRFAEVIDDLTPQEPGGRAVLSDSRSATEYAAVLRDDDAHAALRQYGDLDLAVQVLHQGDVAQRLRAVTRQLEGLLLDLARQPLDADVASAVGDLSRVAQSLSRLAQGTTATA